MSYSDNALAFATLPVNHQVRLEDRVSFAYIDKAVVLQNRTGVWAMQSENDEPVQQQIQIPVGGIAVLALGPGTSITHPAMMSLTRSGATVIFAGGGGNNAYAVATPLTSSSRWALAQAYLVTNVEETKKAAIVLYKQQLGLDMIPGGSINAMRGLEGRTIRDLYRKLAKKHGINSFRRETSADDPVNTGLNLGNSILYGCAAAACSAIGVNPALGIIHRGNRKSMLFDLADLYKPKVTIPAAFAASSEENPAAEVRRLVRKAIHSQKIMAGMLATLMTVLTPHLPERNDDRLVGDSGEVDGHTNYAVDE